MSDSGSGHRSQFEALLLQLPDNDDLDAPDWPIPPHSEEIQLTPSPFEDYQLYPFHWTGESLKEAPVLPISSSQPHSTTVSIAPVIDQLPVLNTVPLEPSLNVVGSTKSTSRKRRFRQLRRAMSLTHIRHKPTPPDTAPPTPTVPNQVPSSMATKSLESLAHWQLPDTTVPPVALAVQWPTNLVPSSEQGSYERPLGQLSPPSSIPSENDILPPGIRRSSRIPSPSPPAPSPVTLYHPTLFDGIQLTDPNVLERDKNGKVIAGTVEGLVAYITSPDCLDYEVLSDFFMMYRKIVQPSRLLGLLCARFDWGLLRGAVVKPPDNEGMVRVRTFAALRHWLLNYFADDFAPSASLRSQFAKAINDFGHDRRVRASARNTRIIKELKRCWNRVCTIYWDGREAGADNEGDLVPGGDQIAESSQAPISPRNRVPSLLLRATKVREEKLGISTSQSQPDLRRRFLDGVKPGTVNSTRPPPARGHTRIHSTSTVHAHSESPLRHKRNASAEPKILYSKNSSPALYQSFARGDGRDEWPPVIVRADLLVTTPKASPSPQSKKKLFRIKRKKIAVEGGVTSRTVSKAPANLSCVGELSDDEDSSSRWTRKTVPSVSTSEPVRDRVDFLAAGMWASFISATSNESNTSLPRAEELGEALVQGYIQPMKVDDESALAIAASLNKGKGVEVVDAPESPLHPRTLSMSEIEWKLEPSKSSSMPLPSTPDSFLAMDMDIRFSSERYSLTPTPPPMVGPLNPPAQALRRRPGGNLRHAETVGELHPRPTTLESIASSMSDFSLALVERQSNLAVPSISTESRSLRSLLDLSPSSKQRQSPAHRMSGLAMDFRLFRIPDDIESSDDDDCDPADAVHKTLLKLEGKYIRKKKRPQQSEQGQQGDSDDVALSAADLIGEPDRRESLRSGSPPVDIMVERDEEARWGKRHKHVVDGQECNTPTRLGPFASFVFEELIDSPVPTDQASETPYAGDDVNEFSTPVPTVESALAELERDQLNALRPRIPSISPPQPPDTYHRSLASHLPFILQYDSTLVAHQFTLIEKDICAEIDWAELTEPRWTERNAKMVDVRDWKGFVLRNEGDGGLDTLVARFNLMTRWTTSEVILTQSLAERIMVITKFIHIALACQGLHNYATLTQIVMGLQSKYVSNLVKTWDGLSPGDMKKWQELQELVDARKNWAKIRNEMDRATVEPQGKGEGCIPFMGIFMSDLVHITPRSLDPGKIDFEGLRLRASIIKKALRLIEMADGYDFQPEPGIGERCLWITAFDEEILRRIATGLE